MSKLGDGVSQAVIEISLGDITTVDVSEQTSRGYRGECPGHGFDTIAKYDDNIRLRSLTVLGNARNPTREPHRLIVGIIIASLHFHACIYLPAVAHNVVYGMPELPKQMHPGYYQLQLQPWVRFDRFHGRAK
jgi:hypothetical protein